MANLAGLAPGTRLQAKGLDDVWYSAEVVDVSTARSKAEAPVKIHYTGYDPETDEWVGTDRLRSKALKSQVSGLTAGMRLQVQGPDEIWYTATVVETSTLKSRERAPVKVNYLGYGPEFDDWVGTDRLRSKALRGRAAATAAAVEKQANVGGDVSGLSTGMRLQAQATDEKWYSAEVVAVSTSENSASAPVKIHYVGYTDADEWVGTDRLRSKALRGAVARRTRRRGAAAPTVADGADLSGLIPGTRLKALGQDEVWYSARVVEVSTSKSRASEPVKIQYDGYLDSDEWVGIDRLRSKALRGKVAATAVAAKTPTAPTPAAMEGADLSGLRPGMRLQALGTDGVWYSALVVEVSMLKSDASAPVKIQYVGYPNGDEWVGTDRLRSKALRGVAPRTRAAKTPMPAAIDVAGADLSGLTPGQRLQALGKDGVWYSADVVQVSMAKDWASAPVKIHYVGHVDDMDEWVGVDRLRSKALRGKGLATVGASNRPTATAPATMADMDLSGLSPGLRLKALGSDGVWYSAEVVQVSTLKSRANAPVSIQYAGAAKQNEWVSVDRLRSKALRGKGAVTARAAKAPTTAMLSTADGTSLSGLSPGMRLQALGTDDVWYTAEVVQVSPSRFRASAPVKIQYVGHPNMDEWVGIERLRSKALK